jgi:large subunit ribosomal protein L25
MQDTRTHLAAEPRTVFGKKVRFLRRSGRVPANVFGNGVESRAIQVPTRETEHLLTHVPRNSLLSMEVDGAPITVLIKEVSRKPTTGELYHIDFYRVSMTQTLRMSVPVIPTGESAAVRRDGATLLQALDSVEIECLPGDLPTEILVDIEKLAAVDDSIYVRDLPVPAKVTILTPEDELVVKALAPTLEREVAEEEAAAEAAAAPQAEAAEEAPAAAEGETEA